MQNDGDFMNVILLYTTQIEPLYVVSFSLNLLLERC